MRNDFLIANGPHEEPSVFRARFQRSHQLLHFIACRVLGGPEQADDAIESCWLMASRNPPRFEYEGAFRGWLVRVLIDQALVLLRDKERRAQNEIVFRKDSYGAGNQLYGKRGGLLKAATEGEY